MPSCPRGWLCWAVSISNRYRRPHSPRYEYNGISDHRMNDRRESAIDITNALDRATDGNGAGKLIMEFYIREMSWYSFSDSDRWRMERAIKRFRRELIASGYLPDPKAEDDDDRGL